MAFEGGPLPLIGVNGGGPVVDNAINTSVNIGLSTTLGEDISQDIGLDLTAGENIIQSQVTPYLTTSLAQNLNQTVTNSLEGLGPAAPILSRIFGQATGALGQAIQGGLNGVGGTWEGVSEPTRQWPGAGGKETPANYGGSVFSGGTGGPDVVFSIQPANQGPQLTGSPSSSSEGLLGGFSIAETFTSSDVPLFNYTDSIPNLAGKAYSPAFSSKAESMGFDIGDSFNRTDTILGGSNGFSI